MLAKNHTRKYPVPHSFDYGTRNRAVVPEIWAQEALIILEENVVMPNLVNLDFSNEVAAFGDVVNTRRPGKVNPQNKGMNGEIRPTNTSAENIAVPLDQHIYQAFEIPDRIGSISRYDLIGMHLRPAIQAIARQIDTILLGQSNRFLHNTVGKLGTSPTKDTLIDLDAKMDSLLFPEGDDRFCVLDTAGKAALLKETQITDADRRGDGGAALRNGQIGRVYNTNYFTSTNRIPIKGGASLTTSAGAVNNTAGYPEGTTVLTVDGIAGVIPVGTWCTIAGDMTPQQVLATVETGGNTTQITLRYGLRHNVLDNAVITFYTAGNVNFVDGYAAGHEEEILINNFTANRAPQVGQLVTFGTTQEIYTALRLGVGTNGAPLSRDTNLKLDRPLAAAIANATRVNPGPAGSYNFAFHRNAITMVSRPLEVVGEGMGARSFVASYGNWAIRVTMSYEPKRQKTLVVVDLLFGVQVLDPNLGVVMLA
jgi:hypothetical protein